MVGEERSARARIQTIPSALPKSQAPHATVSESSDQNREDFLAVRKKPVTLQDVADAAGVSLNTASRALNDKPDVSSRTRDRVLQAAKRLNYVANSHARGLRGIPSRCIAVVVSSIANPYFAEVVEGIESAAHGRGYVLILGNANGSRSKELALIRAFISQQVAGVLIMPTQRDQESLDLLSDARIPFVLVGHRLDSPRPVRAVVVDDISGACLAVKHLIRQGRRRILFLNGPESQWTARQRKIGYLTALTEEGIESEQGLICSIAPSMEAAFQKTSEIIEKGTELDAVFAFNDYMALGSLRAFRQHGIDVPEDVAVMGYDGIALGEVVAPPLSTVAVPKAELGYQAARLLINMIEETEEASDISKLLVLMPELLVRQTT